MNCKEVTEDWSFYYIFKICTNRTQSNNVSLCVHKRTLLLEVLQINSDKGFWFRILGGLWSACRYKILQGAIQLINELILIIHLQIILFNSKKLAQFQGCEISALTTINTWWRCCVATWSCFISWHLLLYTVQCMSLSTDLWKLNLSWTWRLKRFPTFSTSYNPVPCVILEVRLTPSLLLWTRLALFT